MPYSEDFIARVLGATDISAVISPGVQLRRKGSVLMGLCPFHSEKTPSFSVNTQRGFYHCFGCGESGDAISYLRKTQNLTFTEALESLALSAGLPLEESASRPDPAAGMRAKLFALNRDAAKFFVYALGKNRAANEYVASRGVSPETAARFALGYAPPGDGLTDYLLSRGHAREDIITAGLCREASGGLRPYFSGRLIFPILNESGRLAGFGARTMGKSEPKYLNSPESPVFEKRSILFSLREARKNLREGDPLIIVEGYMDVIGLYDKGVKTAVATLGTSLTASHAALLRRNAASLVICYDGDKAGESAATRGAALLMSEGMIPRIALMDPGEDPDSFVLANGRDAFMERLSQAADAVSHRLASLASKLDPSSILSKKAYLAEACALIAGLNDSVAADHFSGEIARVSGTDPELVGRLIASAAAQATERASRPAARRTASAAPLPLQDKGPDPAAPPPEAPAASPKRPRAQGRLARELREGKEASLLAFVLAGRENWVYFTSQGGGSFLFSNEEARACYTGAEEDYLKGAELPATLVREAENQYFIDSQNTINYNDRIATNVPIIKGVAALTLGEVSEAVASLKASTMRDEELRLSESISSQASPDGSIDRESAVDSLNEMIYYRKKRMDIQEAIKRKGGKQ